MMAPEDAGLERSHTSREEKGKPPSSEGPRATSAADRLQVSSGCPADPNPEEAHWFLLGGQLGASGALEDSPE